MSGFGEPAARLFLLASVGFSPEDAAASAIALLTTSVMSIISVKEARNTIGCVSRTMLVVPLASLIRGVKGQCNVHIVQEADLVRGSIHSPERHAQFLNGERRLALHKIEGKKSWSLSARHG